MITDSFDINSEAIISPKSFFGEQKKICDIAIGTFSREIYAAVLERFPNEVVGDISAANRVKPIHLLTVNEQKIVFYLSEIGAALSGTDIIEVNWMTGADKFILFGSAGALDQEKTVGKYVIPSEAYRDEGMSYHYAELADYITVKNADKMEDLFKSLDLSYIKGRVWTTDAIYRETRNMVAARKAEGCIAVEMELAGVQAVCDFYGFELYHFLVTGDVVDQPVYTSEGLHEANHDLDKFFVAIKLAEILA
ncbi:MAG: nucleoside phosphorylase [Eubacteriales bacterium]|nr:nucleoside phosphorylase [Eubacteriales bacterium]